MIHTLSLRLATAIKSVVPEHPASVDVLRYSISFILNTVLVIIVALVISLFTGHTLDVAVAILSFALLRQVSGGLHLQSAVICITVSIAGVSLISFASLGYGAILALNVISLLLVLLFAPSRIYKQTRIAPKHYPLLKLLSALMVSSNFLIGSSVIAVAFFIQALTLIHWKEVRRT